MLHRSCNFVKRNRFGFLISGMLALAVSLLFYAFDPEPTGFPWLLFLLSDLLFLPFVLFLSERHALRTEMDRFLALRTQGKVVPLLVEIVTACMLLSGFWLLSRLALPDPDLLANAISVILTVLAALLLHSLSFPAGLHRFTTIFAYLVYVVYFAYFIFLHGFTEWTEEGWLIFRPFCDNIPPWIHLMMLFLAAAEFRISPPRALISILGFLFFYIGSFYSEEIILADFFVLVLLSNLLGSRRTTAWIILSELLAYLALLALGLQAGWLTNLELYFKYGGYTHALGMGHSNLIALVFLSVYLLVWYLFLQDHPIITLLLSLPGAVGLYLLTLSRTASIILALFSFLNLYRLFMIRKRWTKGFDLLTFLPFLLTALSIFCLFWIPTQDLFSPASNNFFARFTIPYRVLTKQGLHLLGMPHSRTLLDNLYIHLMLFYGIPALVVILALLTWICWQYNRRKEYAELIVLAVFLFYSLMENALIHGIFAFPLLLLADMAEPATSPPDPSTCTAPQAS